MTIDILLAEDEESLALLIKKTIIGAVEGAIVRTAKNGTIAFEEMEKKLPHIYVSDQNMRGLTEVEVLNQSRILLGYEGPAIIVSGHYDKLLEAAQQTGCSNVSLLEKPIDFEKLIKLIQNYTKTEQKTVNIFS